MLMAGEAACDASRNYAPPALPPSMSLAHHCFPPGQLLLRRPQPRAQHVVELAQLAPGLGEPGLGRALGVGEVKFTGQVLPSAKLVSYEIDIKRVVRGRLRMVIADGRTLVDGREIYTAANLRVGLFNSTEAF